MKIPRALQGGNFLPNQIPRWAQSNRTTSCPNLTSSQERTRSLRRQGYTDGPGNPINPPCQRGASQPECSMKASCLKVWGLCLPCPWPAPPLERIQIKLSLCFAIVSLPLCCSGDKTENKLNPWRSKRQGLSFDGRIQSRGEQVVRLSYKNSSKKANTAWCIKRIAQLGDRLPQPGP